MPCLRIGDHKVDSLFRQHNLQKGQQVSEALVPSVAPVSVLTQAYFRKLESLSTCQSLHFGRSLRATAATAATTATAACTQLISQPTRSPVADDDCELKVESTGEALSAAGGHALQKIPSTDLLHVLLCRAAGDYMP